MKPVLPVLIAASFLAGCLETAATPPPADACGASGFAGTVGTAHEAHDFTAADRAVRIIRPNSAVTMDYRAERLNVDVDANGMVTRVWCG